MIINDLIALKNVVLKGTCKESELPEFTKKWDDLKRKYSTLGIIYEVSKMDFDDYLISIRFDIKEDAENIMPVLFNYESDGTTTIIPNGHDPINFILKNIYIQ